MPYNKETLLNLPVEEKYELVMDLWDSIENDSLNVTDEEVQFAKQRLKLHLESPNEGVNTEELKKIMSEKYGF
jgi:putative addiction module component (TIGR02574 family)